MKCPECVASDQRSKVYVGPIFSTAMAAQSFYDEDGVYHVHDRNEVSASYSCSNGHRWYNSRKTPCAVAGCDYE